MGFLEPIIMKLVLNRKLYTKWDQTDNLKRMKDSDILAERERSTYNLKDATGAAVTGALLGSSAATMLGGALNTRSAFKSGVTKPGVVTRALKKTGNAGKFGAIAGVGAGLASYYLKNRSRAEENDFYNRRLRYAQEQAARRESRDWRTNNTQRDGYSY